MEMTAELPYDPDDVDAALRKLGYEVVDLDQWGRSYRRRGDPRHTAELDEPEDAAAYVRLILRRGDLEPPEVPDAEHQVELTYAGLCPTSPVRPGDFLCAAFNQQDANYYQSGNFYGFAFIGPRTPCKAATVHRGGFVVLTDVKKSSCQRIPQHGVSTKEITWHGCRQNATGSALENRRSLLHCSTDSYKH